jgi:PAS domain S-box-containing protein
LTNSRIGGNKIISAGLGLALFLPACILAADMIYPLERASEPTGIVMRPITAVCFLFIALSLIAMRQTKFRLSLGLLALIPILYIAATLGSGQVAADEATPLPWSAPPRAPCFVILIGLSLMVVLSVIQRRPYSRAAVLIACVMTGVGLTALSGLRMTDGSMLLSPAGGLLSVIISAATIGLNHDIGWKDLFDATSSEGPALRAIFLVVLLGPVALGTMVFQFASSGTIRLDLLTILAICAHILLGVGLLFWIWSRIGREEAARRALTLALDTAPIAITDMDGRIFYWSKGCETLYGWSAASAQGQHKQLLLSPSRQSERSLIPSDGADLREVELVERRRDGSILHVREQTRMLDTDADGKRLLALVMTDITDKHAAQARQEELREELIHVSRLSAIGEAAAGFAHELLQPLTATTNFLGVAELMLSQQDANDERLRATLMLVSEQALRAGDIVKRFQAFLTKRPVQIRPEPVTETIRGAIDLATMGMRGPHAQIAYHHHTAHDYLMADRVQIQQVLLNLIRNAIEAQIEDSVDQPSVTLSAEDAEGDMVRISVQDRGPGIAGEVLRAAYRPFTSTKADGMGLGLSICRRIVEFHGGVIQAENMPEGGALLWFTIPAATSPAAMAIAV